MYKKRKGSQNKTLIKQLKKKAIEMHRACKKAGTARLEYAQKCGEALNKLRWETDNWRRAPQEHKKKLGWHKYVPANFPFSVETANIYIRIHKKRDDPRIVKARENDITIGSIAGFLRVLKGQADSKQPSMTEREALSSMARQELRENFAQALRDLCYEELEVFVECFDEHWEDWCKRIYDDACKKGEYDLNEYLWEMGRLGVPQNKRKSLTHYKEVWNKEERLQAVKEMQKQQDEIAERVVKALNKKKRRAVTKKHSKV